MKCIKCNIGNQGFCSCTIKVGDIIKLRKEALKNYTLQMEAYNYRLIADAHETGKHYFKVTCVNSIGYRIKSHCGSTIRYEKLFYPNYFFCKSVLGGRDQ